MGGIAPITVRMTARTPRVEVSVFDPVTSTYRVEQQSGGPASTDHDVRIAFDNAVTVGDHFARTYGRNGFDGKGGATKLLVHPPDPTNAYWDRDAKRIELGDGGDFNADGKVDFAPFGRGLDVVAHEFGHGVINEAARLNTVQGAALHESFSDVFASGVDRNWKIGEDIFTPGIRGDALRDMSKPQFYDHIRKIPKFEDEEHKLSEVPSFAAYKVATAIGADKMRQVWYRGLTEHLNDNSGYAGASRATQSAAAGLFGKDSKEFSAVRDAWKAVGVNPRWTADRRKGLAAAQSAFEGARLVSAKTHRQHSLFQRAESH